MDSGLYKPKHLQRGDKVGIVCTARHIAVEDIEFSLDIIRSWGLVPVLGESEGAKENQFAGSDLLRRNDFQRMLDDSQIRAIIGAKGGYGTVRMMDTLDFTRFMNDPKWVCGFSDLTILHNHIQNALGVRSLHSPMLSTFKTSTNSAMESMRQLLFGEEVVYPISEHVLNREGKAEGVLIGGNLSLIYSLLSGPTAFSTHSKILFLEDLDEYLYHIDRMMMSLKRAGRLQGISGLLVGGMTDMKDNTIPFGMSAEEIILNHIVSEIPVIFGFSAGHVSENYSLELGAQYKIKVEKRRGSLERLRS